MGTFRFFISVLLAVLISSYSVESQLTNHEVYVKTGTIPPTAATLTSANPDYLKNVEADFQDDSFSVCAIGMWALYNTTNFGEGAERKTQVTVMRGFTKDSCATTAQAPAFKRVKTARFLGNPNPSLPGIVIFSEPNFLGSRFYAFDTAASAVSDVPKPIAQSDPCDANCIGSIQLGSIAITGAGRWRICGDYDAVTKKCKKAICIDTSKYRETLYINKNVPIDTSVAWPTYVRAYVANAMDATCSSDPPPPPVPRSLSVRSTDPFAKYRLEIF